jgi:hypothetical protein
MVQVESGDPTEIDYLFDIGGDSIFAPRIVDRKEDEKRGRTGYYQGGQVTGSVTFDELMEMLRG